MLRRALSPFLLAAALGGSGVLSGCDDSMRVQRAPDFPRSGGSKVSVLGVYRDGRLAPEAWDLFRAHLSPLFGTSACEPGYPDILTVSGTPTLTAVDDFTRANGVTDELLEKLSPMAKGDLILLITMTGRPGVKPESDSSGPGLAPSTPMRAGGGSGRRGGPPPKQTLAANANAFEADGLLFSVKAHHSVAAIRMKYTGASIDEAIDRLMKAIGGELPGSTCGGWTFDLHIDASDIKRLEAM